MCVCVLHTYHSAGIVWVIIRRSAPLERTTEERGGRGSKKHRHHGDFSGWSVHQTNLQPITDAVYCTPVSLLAVYRWSGQIGRRRATAQLDVPRNFAETANFS